MLTLPLGGTLPQWGSFLALLTIAAGCVTVWIKGIPDRFRAKNEADQIKVNEAELIRSDYAKQIADFRREVHGYKNELQAIYGQLAYSESARRRRDDRINNMMFVLRLLMSEIRRLDPHSMVLDQAEAMLKQMQEEDTRFESRDPMKAAEDTVKAAQDTVKKLQDGGDE